MSEPCTQPDGCTEPANASMCAHVLNSISTTVMQRCCKVTSESCTRKGVEADLTLHGPSSDQTWIGLLNRFVFILSQISGWTVLDPLKNVERSKAQMHLFFMKQARWLFVFVPLLCCVWWARTGSSGSVPCSVQLNCSAYKWCPIIDYIIKQMTEIIQQKCAACFILTSL